VAVVAVVLEDLVWDNHTADYVQFEGCKRSYYAFKITEIIKIRRIHEDKLPVECSESFVKLATDLGSLVASTGTAHGVCTVKCWSRNTWLAMVVTIVARLGLLRVIHTVTIQEGAASIHAVLERLLGIDVQIGCSMSTATIHMEYLNMLANGYARVVKTINLAKVGIKLLSIRKEAFGRT
jgi:hypothetical protein